MPEDAPGMGTSTAAPSLPALPDKAAQPGASSVGRMVQHIPAPGQPPTTCQFPQLLQHHTRDTTQDRGRGSLTAPSHCCYGWAGSGSPPGIPREEGDISAPRCSTWHPWPSPSTTEYLLINPALGAKREAHILLPWGRRALAPSRPRQRRRAAAGAPLVRGQAAGALAVCPQLTRLAEYRAELHKVSAE